MVHLQTLNPLDYLTVMGRRCNPNEDSVCLDTCSLALCALGWLEDQLHVQGHGLHGALPLFWQYINQSVWYVSVENS